MLDIARFMQDGVGIKTTEYEISLLAGSGSFKANGKIVLAFGYVAALPDNYKVGNIGYIFPPVASTQVDILSTDYGDRLTLTLTDSFTVTYSVTNSTRPHKTVVVSEKR